MISTIWRLSGVPEKRAVSTSPTAQLYRGYDKGSDLTLYGCIFRAADHLSLIPANETGFGWNDDEIGDLGEEIRGRVEADPTVLNDLPKDIRVCLAAGLGLFSGLTNTNPP